MQQAKSISVRNKLARRFAREHSSAAAIQVRITETVQHDDPAHGTWLKVVDIAEFPESWGARRGNAICKWLRDRSATLLALSVNVDGEESTLATLSV